MKRNDYPSPCEKCHSQCSGEKCLRWQIRYRHRQKLINAWARRHCGEQSIKTTVWAYMHPDEFRRYLASDPCAGCLCREWCDDPCPKYLAHFQAKVEHIRKRAQSHDKKTTDY